MTTPTTLPAELSAAFAATVRAERDAREALAAARSAFCAAVRRATAAALALRTTGAPLTAIAFVVARELGTPATVGARRRIAARYRRRIARERRTQGHAKVLAPSPPGGSSPVASKGTTEDEMAARLVKRTVEEFIEEPTTAKRTRRDDARDEALEDALEDLDGVEGGYDDEDDDPPRRRRKR